MGTAQQQRYALGPGLSTTKKKKKDPLISKEMSIMR
jgi:hypothetical protein